ncbi:DNA-3-methyladenine glycosylase I [Candidatus Coxiella mudrowiae]|uniref:DNA-3-methyladenine glycosylase I n=1 Tax=Candidatus Coxiella mudrowiae TaxID=2054173 RepID=UPI003145144F
MFKKRRLTFVGSTIHYAFMQAVGMVNDHTITYFRHKEIENLYLRPNSTLGR